MNDLKSKTPWTEPNITKEEQKKQIAFHFKKIMLVLGMDLTDDSLVETPKRVAKMYVDEIFYGLRAENFPKITVVENKFHYDEMITEANITMNSNCEHHFVPILGKAHISYIADKKVIGLSKLNRIVDYFAKRPQIQERLALQIYECLQRLLGTDNIAVVIDGIHTCVKTRGVKDSSSITRTSKLGGVYRKNPESRNEFLKSIPKITEISL